MEHGTWTRHDATRRGTAAVATRDEVMLRFLRLFTFVFVGEGEPQEESTLLVLLLLVLLLLWSSSSSPSSSSARWIVLGQRS